MILLLLKIVLMKKKCKYFDRFERSLKVSLVFYNFSSTLFSSFQLQRWIEQSRREIIKEWTYFNHSITLNLSKSSKNRVYDAYASTDQRSTGLSVC